MRPARHAHCELIWKPWRIQSVSAGVLQRFEGLRCTHQKRHPPISEASSTSYYPREMAKRFVAGLRGTAIVRADQLVCGFCRAEEDPNLESVLLEDIFLAECQGPSSGPTEEPELDLTSASAEELAMVATRHPAGEPSDKERVRTLANLQRVHANAGHPSNRVLATRLRQDGAPSWVQRLALDLNCDVCDARKPPQPRKQATFDYETRIWAQVGMYYMDSFLPGQKSVAKVLVMVEAASQFVVCSMVFVRTETEHRNATTAETLQCFERDWLGHYPRPGSLRYDPEVCFVSCEWSDALANLRSAPTPQRGRHIGSWAMLSAPSAPSSPCAASSTTCTAASRRHNLSPEP